MKTRKQEILSAAYGLMGTKGLEHVHARTVAMEVGVNHATVHYYFPKRSDLICAVADYALQILLEDRGRFQEGTTASREIIENELALAEAYSKKQSRFVKVLAGLYVASLSDPAVKKKMKALWIAWIEPFNSKLSGSKPKKESAYNDPEMIMTTIFGVCLASHMLDGQLNGNDKINARYHVW